MSLDPTQQQLVVEVARSQVAELAPHELPLFRRTSETYLKRPEEFDKPRSGGGEILGFGVGGDVSFLTPIILALATEVVGFLASELSKQLRAESSEVIASTIKRLFKPFRAKEETKPATTPAASTAPAAAPAAPSLTQQQLTRIRQLAFEKAKQFRLADDQAGLLADSMVGNLVIV